ncbi:PhzF family phenazine biosynthesis protein [Companilactobacillus mishanensis]|uniref:PhzF family phenazine biosynthesis protein n=1 Tax=Companilactobacillus mishanensis TaxID=2486008 RepID=UPI001297C966|nr:PhzF family phenazine biosynthesis protein [Companilactobacillus mishanensis]MQS89691.1 PhzF family phenazine biosynthesis protein [Companilactobacillus mishanensis]
MKTYIVDAFTNEVFKGNPAAVTFWDEFPDDKLMQNIAMENNLSETAFAVKLSDDHYNLRWFTPGGEVDLCGHATLATGFVVFKFFPPKSNKVTFTTVKSGDLTVEKKDNLLQMNFPAYTNKQIEVTDAMEDALGVRPAEAYMARDLLCVLPTEKDVENLHPDLEKLKQFDGLLTNVTAKSEKFDCSSRSFGPKTNVPEDPVCGSAHCQIVPYWSEKLGKNNILAYQSSHRSGILHCELDDDRVKLSGEAALYSVNEVNI